MDPVEAERIRLQELDQVTKVRVRLSLCVVYVCMYEQITVCMYVDCESRDVGQLGVECAGLLERRAKRDRGVHLLRAQSA